LTILGATLIASGISGISGQLAAGFSGISTEGLKRSLLQQSRSKVFIKAFDS
jgi:hypothetical protein